MMSAAIALYSFRRCPFAMRVRMVLHEKGLPFSVHEEDLKKLSEALLKLHPEGKVPVLIHGTLVLYESAVINEYLNEAFAKAPALMPVNASSRAEVRLWTHWCNQIFKPDLDRLKYGVSRFPVEECRSIETKIAVHLKKLETHLSQSDWLVDNQFSLADINVFPFARQLVRIQPPPPLMLEYPAFNRWVDRMSARPSFQRTMEKNA